MLFDDIIIGSGLSALSVAIGLRGRGRRILIFAGSDGGIQPYPGSNVPASRRGRGGMGGYWHGVIPLSCDHQPNGFVADRWRALADYFYPSAALGERMGTEAFFVPRRPIRPAEHFSKFESQGELQVIDSDVDRIEPAEKDVANQVFAGGVQFAARHVWLCAGALSSPLLLARSGLINAGLRQVSDHVIGYAGNMRRDTETAAMMAKVKRHREGVFFPFRFGGDKDHFFTLRPARFDFATLDVGIAKRAVFGLPTSRVISGLAGNLSIGLVAEALYNKFGLFADAPHYSIYFQTTAHAAYVVNDAGVLLPNRDAPPSVAIAAANRAVPFRNVEPTHQPELYIPGIHLHGTLSLEESLRFGPGATFGTLHLVDASSLRNIGPEHHSFAMMAAGFGRAITVAEQD